MYLLQSSGDLLNIILGLCLLVLTFFLCWVLYYVAMSFYNLFKIVKEAREGVEKVQELLEILKKRLSSTVALINFSEEIAHRFLDLVKKKTKTAPASGKKKNSKKTSASKKTKSK